VDKQHLYVDVYQAHHLLANARVGSIVLNLSNITESPAPRWYNLSKVKGHTNQGRGMIQLAVWYEMKDGAGMVAGQQGVAGMPTSQQTLMRAFPNDASAAAAAAPTGRQDSQVLLDTAVKEQRVRDPNEEPRGQLTTAQGPEQTARPAYEYAHATVYADALTTAPEQQTTAPQFETASGPSSRRGSVDDTMSEHNEELEALLTQMMADETVAGCSWSEYSVRMLDTENLDRVASAMMVDLSVGRVVCYVTAPLFRRGFSILVADGSDASMLQRWTNQEIVFALPDQLLAAAPPQDAVLRFSFYYFASSANAHVQTSAPLRESHLAGARGSRAPSVQKDRSVEPIMLGTSVVPLRAVYMHKIESLEHQRDEHPEYEESEQENQQVATANVDPVLKERAAAKRRVAKEHPLTPEQRAAREWLSKWVPLGTPGQTSEAASMCARVMRKEVKMPLAQAVASHDKVASYAPARLRLLVQLPHIGVSVIDRSPEEVAYFCLQNLQLRVDDSAVSTDVQLSLDTLQLDDLTHDAIFPVVLSAAAVKPSDWMPVFQLAIVKQKVPGVNIQCFQYVSFLLQALDVRVSELLIWQLLDFGNSLQNRLEPEQTSMDADGQQGEIIYQRMSDELMLPDTGVASLYFKFLHLQPLAINLTFLANPGVRNQFIGQQASMDAGHAGERIMCSRSSSLCLVLCVQTTSW